MEHEEERATWIVGLWLTNDYESYQRWTIRTREIWELARTAMQTTGGTLTREQAARSTLAIELREDAHLASPIEGANLYADLLTWALQQVDWRSVADRFLSEVIEDDAAATEAAAKEGGARHE